MGTVKGFKNKKGQFIPTPHVYNQYHKVNNKINLAKIEQEREKQKGVNNLILDKQTGIVDTKKGHEQRLSEKQNKTSVGHIHTKRHFPMWSDDSVRSNSVPKKTLNTNYLFLPY
mgnify:CR=1 FL=1